MPDLEDEGGGYGRPPKRHRFQKGQSGNPRGRPRTAQSMPEVVARLRDELVPVTIDGRRKKVRLIEATIRQTIANCFKSSNPRNLEKLLQIFEKYGGTSAEITAEQAEADAEQVVTQIFSYLERVHPDNNKSPAQLEVERQELRAIERHASCHAALQAIWAKQDATPGITQKSALRTQIEAIQGLGP